MTWKIKIKENALIRIGNFESKWKKLVMKNDLSVLNVL